MATSLLKLSKSNFIKTEYFEGYKWIKLNLSQKLKISTKGYGATRLKFF